MFDRYKKKTKLEFPSHIDIHGQKYLIEIALSPKKSSSVTIKDNTLIFRISSYLSQKKIYEHFSFLLKKIYKKVQKKPKKEILTIKNILERCEFKFSDEIYKFEYTTKIRSVKLEKNTFYINPKIKPENIEKYLIKHLIEIYNPRIKHYVQTINKQTYNYKIKEITLKLVSSKWGHCTHDNNLMFNLKLLNAPLEIFNYVIIHELAHVKHKNHSQTYWQEVARFCPNHKILRKQLKNNPPSLFK